MHSRNNGLALLLIVLSSLISAGARADEATSVFESPVLETPFQGQDGKPLQAVPVRITPISQEDVKVEILQVSPNGDLHVVFTYGASYYAVRRDGRWTDQGGVALGVLFSTDFNCANDWASTDCAGRGLLVQFEPRTDGTQVAIGAAMVAGIGLRRYGGDLHPAVVAYDFFSMDAKAVAFREYDGDTFAGLEADLTAPIPVGIGVKYSIQLLRRVFGNTHNNDWLFTLGVGFGF